MDERIKKLPKWAQRHTIALEQRVAVMEKTVARIDEGRTRIHWHTPVQWPEPHYLPDMASVRFSLDGEGQIECYLTPEGLRISSGTTRLQIHPRAANVVIVNSLDQWTA